MKILVRSLTFSPAADDDCYHRSLDVLSLIRSWFHLLHRKSRVKVNAAFFNVQKANENFLTDTTYHVKS